MRIHIGKISPALAERINELEGRLEKYGEMTSHLSLHKKEYGDFFFAFVDMNIDQKQYGALCTALNGVTFRQSKLEIKQARPSYADRMHFGKEAGDQGAKTQAPRLNPEQLKRQRSRPPREIDVYPGRNRDSHQLRLTPTFRVRINGELRKPKMRKRKLWGIKKRPLSKLVDHFVDGEWRDSEGKAVEIVSSLLDEHAQAQKIAEDLAKSAAYLSDSDFEEFKEIAHDLGEAESDDDIEVVPRAPADLSNKATLHNLSSDDEEENIDERDAENTQMVHPAGQNVPENTTESLRTALSADAPFTLFGGPIAEDVTDTTSAADREMAVELPVTAAPLVVKEPKVGLFFLHSNSPYLRSQSQAAKLVDDFDAKAWEEEFFEKRGEWNRSLRKRRRDATRMARRMGKKRGEQ